MPNYVNFVEVALEALQNISSEGFFRVQLDYESLVKVRPNYENFV